MSEEFKNVCPICGEPTYLVYGKHPRKDGLCSVHSKQLFNKIIMQCPDCGKWIETDEVCECKKETKKDISINCLICGNPSGLEHFCSKCLSKYKDSKVQIALDDLEDVEIVEEEEPESYCILCDKDAFGYKFCKDCYYKYKDKSITVAINKLEFPFKVVDEYGNRTIKTVNGLFVRSLSEKIIFDELFKRNIRCEYEKVISFKDDDGEIKQLKPDFYLPDYKLFLEHWGYADTNDPSYISQKEYKENIYKRIGYRVAGTTQKDIEDIASALDRIFLQNDIPIDY